MIKAGHNRDQIPDYTYSEFMGFLRAIRRLRKRESGELLHTILTATRGNEESVEKFFKAD